ncbi:DapH/DapD/GlmU-related protein [Pseudacidovorax sp. 1753]|uniref:acyltransferase n=1 Tax=Pseudacidovorax sp. 1753 TaxID=3156419 RepID=UPI0033979FC9
MRILRNVIANVTLGVLPPTRLFKVKRVILRTIGFEIAEGAKLTGRIRFYGRGEISFGENCWIGIGCTFYTAVGAGVVIEKNCDIAPEVVFHTGTHLLGPSERRAGKGSSSQIVVGEGCWLGCRATVLSGVVIAPGCIVAAGACVNKTVVERDVLVAGTPAKIKRKIDAQS